MYIEQIKGLDELLKQFKFIVNKKITNLVPVGENYWSDIYQLDLTVKNEDNGNEYIEHLVVKCVVNDTIKALMNIPMFKTEIMFYTEIVSVIQDFLKQHGVPQIDLFPDFVTSRLNLSNQNIANDDAVIVLRNLKNQDYVNLDRYKGFNLDDAKLLLDDLATFHAVPLAMKLLDRHLFITKIQNSCIEPVALPEDENTTKPPPFPFQLLQNILEEDSFCRNHLDKYQKMVKISEDNTKSIIFFKRKDPEGDFSTLCHNDMWINNTMQIVNNGIIIKNKFLDFQRCTIDNPALDLIYFIFSSVNFSVIKENFDYLVTYYHKNLIKWLESFKCDIGAFSYEKFLIKMKEAVLYLFMHISTMNMMVFYGKKGERSNPKKNKELAPIETHPVAKDKIVFLFKEMVKRNWV